MTASSFTAPAAPKKARKPKAAPAVAAVAEVVAAPAPQPAAQTAPAPQSKARKTPRGINLAPKEKARACKAGTKQALMVDLLSREGGASMSELLRHLHPWKIVTVRSGLSWDLNSIKGYGVRTTHENGHQRWLACDYEGMGTFRGDSHPDDLSADDKAKLLADNLANGYNPNELFPVYHLVLPKGMTAPVPHDDAVEVIREWATANYSKSYGASALLECFTDEEMRAQFPSLTAAKRWAKLQSEQHASAVTA